MKWSENELNFLIANYATLGCVRITKILNRTQASVSLKAKKLNLKVNKDSLYYTKQKLQSVVAKSFSMKEVLQNLNKSISGDQYNVIKKYIVLYGLDTNHFKKTKKAHSQCNPISFWLKFGSNIGSSNLKQKLYDSNLKTRKCEKCGLGEEWNGEKISLILDHINGISNDNRLENLRILCPNCNATLPTHCRGSKGLIKKEKVVKIKQFKERLNCRKVLIRPTLDVLLTEVKEMGYVKTGKKYGVSDNAIRDWIKTENNKTSSSKARTITEHPKE